MRGRKTAAMFSFRAALVLCLAVALGSPGQVQAAPAKNVIVLIVDGCSAEQYTFARWYKGAPLSFDPYRVGAVKTFIADSVIADSAPAASAFATGVRTSDKHISVGPHRQDPHRRPVPADDVQYRPVCDRARGRPAGREVDRASSPPHASAMPPRAPTSPTRPRADEENDIMEQAVHQGLDVVLGGGRRHLLPRRSRGARTDGENLFRTLQGWGYAVPRPRRNAQVHPTGRVFGLFADNHMDPEIDRPPCTPASRRSRR